MVAVLAEGPQRGLEDLTAAPPVLAAHPRG
jgi:hypothetical protein